MKVITLSAACAAAALLGAQVPALAVSNVQQQPATTAASTLPAARAVFERYVEAIGGEAAVKALKNRTLRGRMTAVGTTNEWVVSIRQAAPNQMHFLIEQPGMMTIETGFDGSTGWQRDASGKVRLLAGEELHSVKDAADMMGEANYQARYKTIETVEKTEFEGAPAVKVRTVNHQDQEAFLFFDVQTGLLLGSVSKQMTPRGEMETRITLSDYTESGGVKYPMKMVQKRGPLETTTTFVDIKTNVESPGNFSPPADASKEQSPR